MNWFVLAIILVFTGCSSDNENEEVIVEYIAHASFKITHKNKSLLIDPFADTIWIGYKFPKNITADAVLISHPHYDHDGGRFRGISPYWEKQIRIIEEGGVDGVGEIKITGIKGKHCDPYGKEFDQKNIIWIIEVANIKMVHIGDNGPLTSENYEAIGHPDILFVPIDGQYHILKADELQVVLDVLDPKIIVPMHYRIPDLENQGEPRTLGDIDPYLIGRNNVRSLKKNIEKFTASSLPGTQEIVVFQHSGDVEK